ncbi:MAG: ABC transporter permease, partial [Firmicutes bacterium]|nr:ABC transporter permease [Bacillota bacterium]
MDKKKNGIIDKIPNWGWLMISLATALVLWYVLSITPKTARCFPFIPKVIEALKTVVEREILWADIKSSMISVLLGFAFGFCTSVPVAFLMAWYRPVQHIVEPWIQFIR